MNRVDMEIGLLDSCAEDILDVEESQEKFLPDIESEEDFDEAWEYFCQMTSKFDYTDSNDYHFQFWTRLIENVKVKENWKDIVVKCTTQAIRTCPLTSDPKEVSWKKYVIHIYNMIGDKELTLEEAKPVLEEADYKFGGGIHTARSYWNIVRFHEEKLHQSLILSEESFMTRSIVRYMLQFGNAYIGADVDWQRFEEQQNMLGEESYNKIKTEYLSNVEFSCWMKDNYQNLNDSYNEVHHIEVEVWLTKLLNNCTSTWQADTFAMQWIRKDPKSVCFYYIYLKALISHQKYAEDVTNVKTIIYKVTKMALKNATTCCVKRILPSTIQSIMFIAGEKLSSDQMLKLVNVLLDFPISKDRDYWHLSRRSVLHTVKHLILKNELRKEELKIYFEKCLEPGNMNSLFKGRSATTDHSNIDKHKKLIDLLVLYVLCEERINKLSWPETKTLWKDSLSHNHHPQALYAYVEFIRSKGTADDAKEAYNEVLNILLQLDNQTYLSRLCRLQLTANHINLLITDGTVEEVIEYSSLLNKWQFEFAYTHKEDHKLRVSPFELNEIISLDPSILSSNVNSSQSSGDYGSIGFALLKQLTKLSIQSYQRSHKSEKNHKPEKTHKPEKNLTSEKSPKPEKQHKSERYPTKGHKDEPKMDNESFDSNKAIFLSNMSYTASEQHIREAFAKNDLPVFRVIMDTKPNGNNYGYGTVVFQSKSEAQFAVNNLDGIEIKGRKTFVSVYREKSTPKNAPKSEVNEASVLYLSDVPKDWQDPKTLELAFAPFGHVKSVTVDDKIEPVVARVDFVFPSDARNGFEQWKDGKLLVDTGIKLRLGYAGKKRPHVDLAKTKSNKSENNISPKEQKMAKIDTKFKSSYQSTNQEDKEKKQYSGKLLVPRVLQRSLQKKVKLEVGANNMEVTPTSVSKECGPLPNEEARSTNKLTNEDFKNMFKNT